jgi:hypothetical protein
MHSIAQPITCDQIHGNLAYFLPYVATHADYGTVDLYALIITVQMVDVSPGDLDQRRPILPDCFDI